MNIMELIPSEDIRAYMEQTGWSFSDREQAGILFNYRGLALAEKAARLRELGDRTEDRILAEQIGQRLALGQEMRDLFFRDGPGIFYMLDDACNERPVYYAKAEDAIRRGKREGGRFEVCKYHLIGAPGLPPVHNEPIWNPYLFKARQPLEKPELPDEDRDDNWAGYAGFNEHGELYSLQSSEPLSISMAVYTEMCFSVQRFENRYVELPNPFQRGDIVQVTGRFDHRRRGVVETSQEEWERFNRRIRDDCLEGVDFFDACLTVEFPVEGGFSHWHINPLYLERCQPEKDDPDHDILEAGSLMLRGDCGLEYFVRICRTYGEECGKK